MAKKVVFQPSFLRGAFVNIRGGRYPQKDMEHGQFGVKTPMGHSEWNIVIERDLHPGTSIYNSYFAI